MAKRKTNPRRQPASMADVERAKWSERSKAYYCRRRWAMHKVRERDFCSYGRRKDGET